MEHFHDEIMHALRDYIISTFPRARYLPVSYTTNIIDNDIIDSLGMISILNYIESTYSLNIDDDDIIDANFSSIHAMADMIITKLNIEKVESQQEITDVAP